MIENPKHLVYGEVSVAPLTQGAVEAFYKYLRENDIKAEERSFNEYAGDLVRAAVAVGWFPGVMVAEIANMEPWKVTWLYQWINQFLISVMGIDPNSSGPSSSMPATESDGLQKN